MPGVPPDAFDQVKKVFKGIFKRKKRPKMESTALPAQTPQSQPQSQSQSRSQSEQQGQQPPFARRIIRRRSTIPETSPLATTGSSQSQRPFVPSPVQSLSPVAYGGQISPQPPSTPVSSIRPPELSTSPTTPSRSTRETTTWSEVQILAPSIEEERLELVDPLPAEPQFEDTLVPSDDESLHGTAVVADPEQGETSDPHRGAVQVLLATSHEASEEDPPRSSFEGDGEFMDVKGQGHATSDAQPSDTESLRDEGFHDMSLKTEVPQEPRHEDDMEHVNPVKTPDTVSPEPSLEHEGDKSAAETPATTPTASHDDSPRANEARGRASAVFSNEKIPVMAEPPRVRPISVVPGMVATSGPLEDYPFSFTT